MINEKIGLKGIYTFELHDAKTGELVEKKVYENLVPTVALNALAQQMSGDNSQEAEITYFAFGDSTTAVALGDTTLGNETVRKLLTTRTNSGGVSTLQAFFNTGEANDTHKEAGLFGDGAASTAGAGADSGILYSHVAVNITKTAANTLTVTYTLTFS